MNDRDRAYVRPGLPECAPATDGALENLIWYTKQAAAAEPERRIGLWVQMAYYVPPVLSRLRKTESERDAAVAYLQHLQKRLLRLATQAQANGENIDPGLLTAFLTAESVWRIPNPLEES